MLVIQLCNATILNENDHNYMLSCYVHIQN